MRRQAKESSAGSTEGSGMGRRLFRCAFATGGGSSRISGSGAPARRLALFALLALAVVAAFGASTATAADPTLVLNTVENPTYTTVEITGEIDPHGEAISWSVERSTDEVNWEGTSVGNFIEGSQVSGPQPVEGTVTELTAGQTYFFRLGAYNFNAGTQTFSAGPYLEATTESIPAPSVTIDPVTTFSATTAHLVGHIDPNSPPGDPAEANVNWHFECEPECPGLAGGVVDASAEGEDQKVEADATGLEPNTEYKVRLIGKNAGPPVSAGPVGFTTDVSAPVVQTLPAFAIRGGTEALVGGSVNPRNSATTYWVEWGPTTTYGQKVPATPANAGSGGTPEIFTERLTGLTPSTVYHVRLVAENSSGDKSEGVDQSFETAPASEAIQQNCPNATLRVENNSTALPECRAYEQVSPTDKNGFGVARAEAPEAEALTAVASENGSRFGIELAAASFGDAKTSQGFNPYIFNRSESGWNAHALLPAMTPGTRVSRVKWWSSDLQKAALRVAGAYHLAEGDFPGEGNLYLEDTQSGGYTSLNAGGLPPGDDGSYNGLGGSPDGGTFYFETPSLLLPNAPGNGFEGSIYEWTNGELKLASVSPNNVPLLADVTGVSGNTYVSTDGTRLIFQGNGGSIYLRESGQTFEIASGGNSVPSFAGASPSLSAVLFVSPAALTPGAADDGKIKLYRYNAGPKTITQISPNAPDGGQVSDVLGVSPDGSYVYFRSTAQYVSGQGVSNSGFGGLANLYMWHDGVVSFIATESEPEENGNHTGSDTSRVSPDGTFLIFQSKQRLTTYDNTDQTPGPGGEVRRDREIYVWDATSSRLTCVSCNPSGEPPGGTSEGADAGSGLPISLMRRGNAPQSGVSDDGTVFFNSRDALVPADVNGVQDVYEWRAGTPHLISSGTGADPAELASFSPSGSDVFFGTNQRLVPADRDELSDIYDARVGGGFAPPRKGSTCESIDVCHGSESAPPTELDLGSANLPPEAKVNSAKLRLRKALKACRHKPKKARAKCRAAAKKKFKHGSTGRAHR